MDLAAAASLLAQLDREVWLLTSCAASRRGGLIATFVSNASIVPDYPRMVVGLSRQHHTYDLVEESRCFALHLLDEGHLEWVWRFGLQSGRDVDKFEGLAVQTAGTGCPLLADALGWLECRVEGRLNTGDRSLYLGKVVDARLAGAAAPLTFKRLLKLAPPERLQELEQQRVRDSAVDAAAIDSWRQLMALRE